MIAVFHLLINYCHAVLRVLLHHSSDLLFDGMQVIKRNNKKIKELLSACMPMCVCSAEIRRREGKLLKK